MGAFFINIIVRNFKQGIYNVQNWEKYLGTQSPIYRSSWEFYIFKHFDFHPSVLEWHSEPVAIPYFSHVKGRNSRYFPDIYAKIKTKKGVIKKLLIEVKPKAQTIPPKKTKKKNQKNFLQEQQVYQNNQEKWDAAKKYCDSRDMEFLILTEDDIFK